MSERPAPDDPIDRLREQIRSATEAAERLVREAGVVDPGRPPHDEPPDPRARGVRSSRRHARDEPTPPSGWATSDAHREATGELQALTTLYRSVRELLPADVQHQLSELVRQLLLLLRALIDWAVSRLEHEQRGRDVEVEDIPIV